MLFDNDKARAEFAMSSFDEMGDLMKSVGRAKKASAQAKKALDRSTIRAHAINIAAILILGMKDEAYGDEGHRNTTSGPAYREQLQEAGFSETKAKLFWEYGQLALKEPVAEAGDFTGLVEAINGSKDPVKTVAAFLAKQEITKEADLKKVVQPVAAKTFEEKVLDMIEKAEMTVSDAATALQSVLDTLEEKATAPSNEVAPVQSEAKEAMAGLLAALAAKKAA